MAGGTVPNESPLKETGPRNDGRGVGAPAPALALSLELVREPLGLGLALALPGVPLVDPKRAFRAACTADAADASSASQNTSNDMVQLRRGPGLGREG